MPKTRTKIIEESDWVNNSVGKIFVDNGEDLFYSQPEVDELKKELVEKLNEFNSFDRDFLERDIDSVFAKFSQSSPLRKLPNLIGDR